MSKKPSKEFLRASKSVKLNRQLNKLDGNKRSRRTYQSLAAPIKDKISSINVFNKLLGRKRGTRKWSPTMESRKGKGTRKSMRRRRKTKKRKYRKNKKSRKNRRPRRYRKYGGSFVEIPITPLEDTSDLILHIQNPQYTQLTQDDVNKLLELYRLREDYANQMRTRLMNLTKENIKDLRYPSYNERVNYVLKDYNEGRIRRDKAITDLRTISTFYINDIRNYAIGILNGTVQG